MTVKIEPLKEPALKDLKAQEVGLNWSDLGLSQELLTLILEAGYNTPTPVQARAIPFVLAGKDVLASAQTGTGKTAAFALPLLDRIKGRKGTKGLVLSPSREIALQTHAVLEQFGNPLGVKSAALIGGVGMRHDDEALRTYPEILVATPGRLCDHLERGNIWLEYLETVVLDEADRMLDMGFSTQLNLILDATSKGRQTLLFSATFPKSVEQLAHKIMNKPERVQVGRSVSATKTVEQRFVFTREENKFNELQKLLRREKGTVFIFVKSKIGVDRLWRSLHSRGFYEATRLHSDLRQSDREQSLQEFKDGKYRVLIATDVVGRGIHVDEVSHVVNYDMPRDVEDYVHRIGRTGRAASEGMATSFVVQRDEEVLDRIEKMLGYRIESFHL